MGNAASNDEHKIDEDNKKMNECKKQKDGIFIKFESTKRISNEMKKKSIPMPDSLYAEHNDGDSEKILSSDGIDRRIRAPIHIFNNNKNEINNIVLLSMQFNNQILSGTGTIIHRALNALYILTCAHNIIQINKELKHTMKAEVVEFSLTRNTPNGYQEIACYPAIEWVAHPKYNKTPSSSSGHDIAIIKAIIDIDDELLTDIKPLNICKFGSKSVDIKGAKIIGYPGKVKKDNVSKAGALYGMSGDYNLNDKGTLITYKQIDSSPGQSGSPIFCHEENKENKEDDIFNEFGVIIGVHTGGNKAMGQNWGTAVNDEKLKWIANILEYESVAQPNYQCNALLICSDDVYEESMNKMYKTFNRSQVINTKKLYFNINDGIINKEHILDGIDRMFGDAVDSQKRMILCFCGDSDKNGNWMINKNNGNGIECISLNDIISIEKKSGNKKKFIIISDCSYSENWIIEANKYDSDYRDKVIIQASARKDQIATIGVFMSKYSNSCLTWYSKSEVGLVRLVPTAFGLIPAIPVTLVWDNGVKRVYHLQKTFKPVSSHQYYHKEGRIYIADTNDDDYKVYIVLTNSWTAMDTDETAGGVLKYGGLGLAGNC